MKVLVTGASGMLGRHVAQNLVGLGHEVATFQRSKANIPGAKDINGSITNLAEVKKAVKDHEAVIHLAAKVSISGPEAEFKKINIEGTKNIITAMRNNGGGKLVNISSPSVAHYGKAIVGLGATKPEPQRARGPYARTKAAAELLAMAADSNDGMLVTSIRPHVVWGPGDTQLVERIVQRAASGRLPLLDRGMALIDTTYVDNAAEAIVAALENIESIHAESFVVTNAQPRTVRDIMVGFCDAASVSRPELRVPGSLARLAGKVIENLWQIRPGYDEPPMTEFLAEQLSTAHWFDQRRTQEALNWQPRISIDEGFARLKEYFDSKRYE